MKFYVLCDYRENFKNYSTENSIYNDHPNQKNINEIISAIIALGYECEYFGGIPELIHAVDNKRVFTDCIFLNFTDGMDEKYSRVQAPVLLDILKVPYSGSDVFSCVLMNNKHFCKKVLEKHSILMPKSRIVTPTIPLNTNEFTNWKKTLFVKPNCEGSSLGISDKSVCHRVEDVRRQCKDLLQMFDEILVEEYIDGIDVTNYLIGNQNSYPTNDVVTAELFNKSPYAIYGSKEKENKLRTLFINDEYWARETIVQIQTLSTTIAKIVNAKDICRIDYRINPSTKEIYFIESNSAPRFSSSSEIGFIAQKRGISFENIVKIYINTVLQRLLN